MYFCLEVLYTHRSKAASVNRTIHNTSSYSVVVSPVVDVLEADTAGRARRVHKRVHLSLVNRT